MPNVEFQYVLLVTLAIALMIAAITDIRRRQIDNWLNAAIALAATLYWWASGLNLWPGGARSPMPSHTTARPVAAANGPCQRV